MSEHEMSIYVACLACYNDGTLRGVRINGDDLLDADAIRLSVAAMQAGCGHTDNDYAIHDHEGLGPVNEFDSFATIAERAALLAECSNPDALLAYIDDGSDPADFDDAYCGRYDRLLDYAYEYIDSTGMLDGVNTNVAHYFDYESFARDLEISGDVWTTPAKGGGVYVFGTV